jgi:hypothetical protein
MLVADTASTTSTTPATLSYPAPQEEEDLLTPLIHRLLKLIRHGTPEQASQATTRLLSLVTNLAPPALWDVMGRLQETLSSARWKTRRQGSGALQRVAQQLPSEDQELFLLSTSSHHRSSNEPALYMTVSDLEQDLGVVLEKGRLLYARSSSQYDSLEEAELEVLDQSVEEQHDFVQNRIYLQRRILAQRLGLLDISQALGVNQVLPDEITADDILCKDKKGRKRNSRKRKSNKDSDDDDNEDGVAVEKSVRALLIMEMKHQKDDSHRSSQSLLANELVYRTSDPVWQIRHGSILGLLALWRAWRPYSNSFGIWSQDLLARCLCVLALDRFGDFSGSFLPTGSVVAPVREVAGQLLSVIWMQAPIEIQTSTLRILTALADYGKDWEVRHGALIGMKYITAILRSEPSTVIQQDLTKSFVEGIVLIAVNRLTDRSDDVKSVSAQLLYDYIHKENEWFPSVLKAPSLLWSAIQSARPHSSHLTDLLQAFSHCLLKQPVLVFQTEGKEDFGAIVRVIDTLNTLMIKSDYISVKLNVIRCFAPLANVILTNIDVLTKEDFELTQVAFVNMVTTLFQSYLVPIQDESVAEDLMNDYVACRAIVWDELCSVAKPILNATVIHCTIASLLTQYLCAERTDCTNVPTFHSVLQMSDALAKLTFHVKSDGLLDLLESIQVLFLQLPVVYHVEGACALLRALDKYKVNVSKMRCAKGTINETLQRGFAPSHASGRVGNTSSVSETEKASTLYYSRFSQSKITLNEFLPLAVKINDAVGHPLTALKSIDHIRLMGSMAAGLLVFGMPDKVTPVAWALMNSLNNETCSGRQIETGQSLLCLVQMMRNSAIHTKGYNKLIANICATAEATDGQSNGVLTAKRIIKSISQEYHTLEQLKQSEVVLWGRCSKIPCQKDSQHWEAELVKQLRIFRAVCSGCRETSIGETIVDDFTPSLVYISCEATDDCIQVAATTTIEEMILTQTRYAFSKILSCLTPYFSSPDLNHCRVAACRVLLSMATKIGTDLCYFVRILLPLVMPLLTERDEECSKLTHRMFADLVAVAPLTEICRSHEYGHPSENQRAGNLVLDHLIEGRPLPPCELHEDIKNELSYSNTKLRNYQLEGVAWIQFLQSMRLNGVLCDSMGLGKTLQALLGVAVAHCNMRESSPDCPLLSLVVCPSTLVGHWHSEITKFFPSQSILSPISYVGSVTKRNRVWQEITEGSQHFNIVVTSYSCLRSDIYLLSMQHWCYCILDEGHLLKNPKTGM